jgi:hypothetical protein
MFERRSAVLLALATAFVVAVASVACGDDGNAAESEPPTPIAFLTPPVPERASPLDEFSPECDAKVIKVARGEAKLRDAIFDCETPLQWAGALRRYPSALGPNSDEGDVFVPLFEICFRTSPAEFAASRLCQAVIAGRTVTP